MDPITIAAGIGAATSLIQGSKNRSSASRADRYNAKQAAIARSEQDKYTRNLMRDEIGIRKRAAEESGVHPLFALGSPGISPAPAIIPGQSALGSMAKDDIANAGAAISNSLIAKGTMDSQKEAMDLQAQLVQSQIKYTNAQTADILSDIARKTSPGAPPIDANGKPGNAATAIPYVHDVLAPAQELKLGEMDAHRENHREQNLNEKSIMTKVKIGNQDIWVPTEEIDSFFEDPLAIGAATFTYHGNKNVDWPMLINYWMKGKNLTPAQVSEGTRRMKSRLNARLAQIKKLKRRGHGARR